jgi:hypothetical protein
LTSDFLFLSSGEVAESFLSLFPDLIGEIIGDWSEGGIGDGIGERDGIGDVY